MTEKSPASTSHIEQNFSGQEDLDGAQGVQTGAQGVQTGAQGDSCPDGQAKSKAPEDARPTLAKSHSQVRARMI